MIARDTQAVARWLVQEDRKAVYGVAKSIRNPEPVRFGSLELGLVARSACRLNGR